MADIAKAVGFAAILLILGYIVFQYAMIPQGQMVLNVMGGIPNTFINFSMVNVNSSIYSDYANSSNTSDYWDSYNTPDGIISMSHFYNKTDSDGRYLSGNYTYTETDPFWSGNVSSVAFLINQGNWNTNSSNYWDGLNSPNDITSMTYFYNKTDSDGRYLQTYLESDPLWAGNSSTVARAGNCPGGQFVANTTSGGVQCSTPTEPLWSGNTSTIARTGTCAANQYAIATTTGGITCASINASQIANSTWLTGESDPLWASNSSLVLRNNSAGVANFTNLTATNITATNFFGDINASYVKPGNFTGNYTFDGNVTIHGNLSGGSPLNIISDVIIYGNLTAALNGSAAYWNTLNTPDDITTMASFYNKTQSDNRYLYNNSAGTASLGNVTINGTLSTISVNTSRAYTITNTDPNATNAQVRINVTAITTNGTDMRWTWLNGSTNTSINFWRSDGSDGDMAWSYADKNGSVWINVPTLPTGNTTVYLTWNTTNNTLTDASNAAGVFYFYEPCNSNSSWTNVSNTNAHLNTSTGVCRFVGGANIVGHVRTTTYQTNASFTLDWQSLPNNITQSCFIYSANTGTWGGTLTGQLFCDLSSPPYNAGWYTGTGASFTSYAYPTITAVWQNYTAKLNATNMSLYISGSLIASNTTNTSYRAGYLGMQTNAANTSNVTTWTAWDNIRVRYNFINEPTYAQDNDSTVSSWIAGITNTASYWLCTAANCATTCRVRIVDGLITGCT